MPDELINTTYLLRESGRLFVQQVVKCMSCRYTGLIYLDMSYVESDEVRGVECIFCKATDIKVITFDLIKDA